MFSVLDKWVLNTVIFGLLLAVGKPLHAEFVVVPNRFADEEAQGGNRFPFFESQITYQQLYSSSAFSALKGPAYVSEIRFRPDSKFSFGQQQGPFEATLSDVTIGLSTSNKTVENLTVSPTLNRGADYTVVRSGPLQLQSSASGPINGPKEFDVVIDLHKPFLYDPRLGSLLLEVENPGINTAGNIVLDFDGIRFEADEQVTRGFLTSTISVQPGTGLVTGFVFVPEPSPFLLLAVVAISGLACRSRRSTKSGLDADASKASF